MWRILLLISLSIIGGILYKAGGTARGTKWRDAGVPTVGVIAMLVLQKTVFNVDSAACYALWWGLCFGALTTYNKWAYNIFGYRDKEDVHAISWLVTGLTYGLAALPFAFLYSAWVGFTLRTVLLAAGVMLWSVNISKVWLEEFGRGALIIGSLPLLLI